MTCWRRWRQPLLRLFWSVLITGNSADLAEISYTRSNGALTGGVTFAMVWRETILIDDGTV